MDMFSKHIYKCLNSMLDITEAMGTFFVAESP